MSYDLRFGTKVATDDGSELFVVIGYPEYDSPTYNLGKMFRACTGWDFVQGEWYRAEDVLPLIRKGLAELIAYPGKYRKYEPENKWGTVGSAVVTLQSLIEGIEEYGEPDGNWSAVPLKYLYVRW